MQQFLENNNIIIRAQIKCVVKLLKFLHLHSTIVCLFVDNKILTNGHTAGFIDRNIKIFSKKNVFILHDYRLSYSLSDPSFSIILHHKM